MRGYPTGRRRLMVAGVLAAVVALGVSGCTAARNTLGTNSSPCFRALALAEDAVHSRGSFSGVRLVPASSLSALPRLRAALTARSSTPLHNLCLVSYRGTFRLDQVSRPAGRGPRAGVGHFAIVVVSNPQNVLLATFVLNREPVRFRHLALGAPRPGRGPPGVSGTE